MHTVPRPERSYDLEKEPGNAVKMLSTMNASNAIDQVVLVPTQTDGSIPLGRLECNRPCPCERLYLGHSLVTFMQVSELPSDEEFIS